MSTGSVAAGQRAVVASLLLGLLLLGVACASEDEQAAGLQAQAAWVRTPPPGARMLAGYLGLSNTGEQAIKLVAARSPAFGMVEIHESFQQEGRMRMREVKPLVIEPGQSVDLQPGGLHLMLMRPQTALTEGDTVRIVLIDEQQRQWPVDFQVRRDAPQS